MDPDYAALILEELPDALIVTTPEGRILHWSPGAATTFGYSAAEALDQCLEDLVVPADYREEDRR
ncbi:MAG: PAS domain S-box protein, partial [Candidatus Eremiobacterota bacterium]